MVNKTMPIYPMMMQMDPEASLRGPGGSGAFFGRGGTLSRP